MPMTVQKFMRILRKAAEVLAEVAPIVLHAVTEAVQKVRELQKRKSRPS